MNLIETGLYSALSADSNLLLKLGGTAIWCPLIPQGQDLPAVVFSYAGGGEENLTPHRMVNTVYAVKGISQTSMKHAGEIAELINTALHGQTLTITGWSNFWLAREGLIRYHEIGPGGEDYYHAGAYYRCRLDKNE